MKLWFTHLLPANPRYFVLIIPCPPPPLQKFLIRFSRSLHKVLGSWKQFIVYVGTAWATALKLPMKLQELLDSQVFLKFGKVCVQALWGNEISYVSPSKKNNAWSHGPLEVHKVFFRLERARKPSLDIHMVFCQPLKSYGFFPLLNLQVAVSIFFLFFIFKSESFSFVFVITYSHVVYK